MPDLNPPPNNKNNPRGGPPPRRGLGLLWYVLLAFFIMWLWQQFSPGNSVRTIPYSEFKDYLARGEVVKCVVGSDEIRGEIKPSEKVLKGKPKEPEGPKEEFSFRTDAGPDRDLVRELQKAGVDYRFEHSNAFWGLLFTYLLPLGFLVLVMMFLFRGVRTAGESVLSFGKSRARLNMDKNTGVTFADVAGCDEAKYELQEVVDFLKNPDRYRALGAQIPKGVLLTGPPGTGKTLLARAVAGEASVPFFHLSGSDFVEMFVGVGAARVRDLFKQAKDQAPCIIFIDELDAIGRQRGVHIGTVNDEREQTLNQLLVEMDGFEANTGIIIIGATNRPEVLDRALLRPGRFDRQVVIDAPDLQGREEILKIHTRKKPLADDVDLHRVAQATPGFSGADLANATNEAALLAARRGAHRISQEDLEEAVEKVVAGPERKSRRLIAEEKRRVAYHEVGHALVAAYSKYADPVHKISIVPRGKAALGFTLQLPADEQFLMTRSMLLDKLKGMLGGRASEETVYHEVSTGAENDLERATAIARQMVCMFGMSSRVGLVHVGHRQNGVYLGAGDGASLQMDCSEETAREIDEEVKKFLDEAYAEARRILSEHRDQLELVAQELLKRESLDAKAFKDLIGRSPARDGDEEKVPVPALNGRTEVPKLMSASGDPNEPGPGQPPDSPPAM